MKSLLFLMAVLSSASFAARSGPPSGGAKRGGQGFLFEDFNGFSNPAQKALFRGFSIQTAYETTLNTGNKSVTPSIVWGKGSFGMGGFATRSGTDLSDTGASSDAVGGAMGLGLAANRLTVGVGFSRSIDTQQIMDGTLTASANLNGLGGKGFHMGGAMSTTVNRASRDITTATGAVGWGFGRTAIEAVYGMSDLQDPAENFEASGYFTWEGETFFLGLGFGYEKPVNSTFASGRTGFRIGKIDLSVFGHQSFASGANPNVGAALRLKL